MCAGVGSGGVAGGVAAVAAVGSGGVAGVVAAVGIDGAALYTYLF